MADLRVPHPRFQNQILSVRPAGMLGAKLLLNGVILKRQKGVYSAVDDGGVATPVRLKTAIDPIPKVDIDGTVVEIARPLAWYEYAWAAWPILLIGLGGAIGGLLGGAAAAANLQIIRKDWSAPARYAACAALGVLSAATWGVIAALIQSGSAGR